MEPNADPDKKYFDVAKPRTNTPSSAPPFKYAKRQMINIDDGQEPPEESSPKSSVEDDTVAFDDTLIEPEEAFEPTESSSALSHPELDAPDHIDIDEDETKNDKDKTGQAPKESEPTNDEDIPFVNPLPGTIKEEPKDNEDDQNQSSEETVDGVEQKTIENNNEPQLEESTEQEDAKSEEQVPLKEDVNSEKQLNTPPPSQDRFVSSDALPDPKQSADDEPSQDMQDPKIFDTKEYYVPIGNTHHNHGSLKMALAFGVLCAAIVVGAVLYYMLKISN